MVHPNMKKVKFDKVPVKAFSKQVSDPRLNTSRTEKSINRSLIKPISKLYSVKWSYDKYSIGDKPAVDIVIWNLQSTTTSMILRNHFSEFGSINEVKLVEDPETAVPLGMALVVFGGDLRIAHENAIKAANVTNRKLTIQGRVIRCGVNTDNKIYEEIYKKTMDARKQRLIKQNEEKKEQERAELLAKQTKQQEELLKLTQGNTNLQPIKALAHPAQMIPSTMTLSAHDRHILPYSTCILPNDFDRQIKNKPFIFVCSQYVSPNHVNSSMLRSWLGRNRVLNILSHETGFYIIFSSLNDAQICFDTMDGRRMYSIQGIEYKLYMTLYIPNHWMRHSRIGHLVDTIFPTIFSKPIKPLAKGPSATTARNGVLQRNNKDTESKKPMDIDAAAKVIQTELGDYLRKDIFEFTINKMVKSALVSPEIQVKRNEWEELKKREAEERKLNAEKMKMENGKAVNTGGIATIVKSLDVSLLIGKKKINSAKNLERKKKKKIIYDDESDDDMEIPANQKKRRYSLDDESKNADTGEDSLKSLNSDNDELETPTTTVEPDVKDEGVNNVIEENVKIELESKLQSIYDPTYDSPQPVYENIELNSFKPTLAWLKSCIKDDEDFSILQKLAGQKASDRPIKNLDYWGWSHMEAHINYESLMSSNQNEDSEEADKFDFEEEIRCNMSLRNVTGSFRTEPYKKISDNEKNHYLIHRRKLTQLNPVSEDQDEENTNTTSHASVQSSRVNRANDRRLAADINMIGAANLELNKLNKRKKPVQFARSAIHNWGLYALEPISAGEMIIEYVGERIRQQIAELREKKYLRSGIGSSYLFRVDESTVIDASKKGGIARFINHCCEPSCTAKIIKVDGSKRIVIYALRDIKKNEELTYDYKFERETNDAERITCLCGAKGCKGFLN